MEVVQSHDCVASGRATSADFRLCFSLSLSLLKLLPQHLVMLTPHWLDPKSRASQSVVSFHKLLEILLALENTNTMSKFSSRPAIAAAAAAAAARTARPGHGAGSAPPLLGAPRELACHHVLLMQNWRRTRSFDMSGLSVAPFGCLVRSPWQRTQRIAFTHAHRYTYTYTHTHTHIDIDIRRHKTKTYTYTNTYTGT